MASFKCDSTMNLFVLIMYASIYTFPDVEKNFDSGVKGYTHRLQNNFEEGVSFLSFYNFLRFGLS